MKKVLLSALFLSLGANGMASGDDNQSLSLAQLKEMCHKSEEGTQATKFKSGITCTETKDIHRDVGQDERTYETMNRLSFQIKMKDMQSKMHDGKGSKQKHTETCRKVERWQVTASDSVTFMSCDELDAVSSEEEFCEQQLASRWATCDTEMNDSSFSSSSSSSGACEYVKVGETQTCNPNNTSTDSISDILKANGMSSSQASVSSTDVDYNLTGGSEVQTREVDRGKWHGSHKVVFIKNNPAEGSALYNLGVRRGDQISKVGKFRVRKEKELVEALRKLERNKSSNPDVRLDYMPAGSTSFTEENRSLVATAVEEVPAPAQVAEAQVVEAQPEAEVQEAV